MNTKPQYNEALILVVDDSEMNLKVAEMIMGRYGIKPECVYSGRECIEHVCDKKYDLIFMDHLMKDMDGIETINVLRKNSKFKTPVIALTANASEGADKMYKEAGFSGLLNKPLIQEELEVVLNTYLNNIIRKVDDLSTIKNGTFKAEVIPEVSSRSDAIKFYLENEGINATGAIDTIGNDEDSYVEILQMFVDEAEEKRSELKEYLDENNIKDYTILVHSLKSDSLLAGAERLSAIARQHELAGKGGEINYIIEQFGVLTGEWDKTLDIMNRFLQVDNSLK